MALINQQVDEAVEKNKHAQRRRIDAVNELLQEVIDGVEKRNAQQDQKTH